MVYAVNVSFSVITCFIFTKKFLFKLCFVANLILYRIATKASRNLFSFKSYSSWNTSGSPHSCKITFRLWRLHKLGKFFRQSFGRFTMCPHILHVSSNYFLKNLEINLKNNRQQATPGYQKNLRTEETFANKILSK